jgi:predicted chitinase
MNPPVILTPERLRTNDYDCVDSDGWFWAKNKLHLTADNNDPAEMTRKFTVMGPLLALLFLGRRTPTIPDD